MSKKPWPEWLVTLLILPLLIPAFVIALIGLWTAVGIQKARKR